MKLKSVLLTGSAGFIGASVAKHFLKKGHKVIGIDNINNYYDINLKKDRLKDIEKLISSKDNWKFYNFSIFPDFFDIFFFYFFT